MVGVGAGRWAVTARFSARWARPVSTDRPWWRSGWPRIWLETQGRCEVVPSATRVRLPRPLDFWRLRPGRRGPGWEGCGRTIVAPVGLGRFRGIDAELVRQRRPGICRCGAAVSGLLVVRHDEGLGARKGLARALPRENTRNRGAGRAGPDVPPVARPADGGRGRRTSAPPLPVTARSCGSCCRCPRPRREAGTGSPVRDATSPPERTRR